MLQPTTESDLPTPRRSARRRRPARIPVIQPVRSQDEVWSFYDQMPCKSCVRDTYCTIQESLKPEQLVAIVPKIAREEISFSAQISSLCSAYIPIKKVLRGRDVLIIVGILTITFLIGFGSRVVTG